MHAGYKVADKGCCGTGKLEVSVLCNPLSATCPDNSEYIFWDSYHPTESVYRKLVAVVLPKYVGRLTAWYLKKKVDGYVWSNSFICSQL